MNLRKVCVPSQESGVRGQESGVRGQESGVMGGECSMVKMSHIHRSIDRSMYADARSGKRVMRVNLSLIRQQNRSFRLHCTCGVARRFPRTAVHMYRACVSANNSLRVSRVGLGLRSICVLRSICEYKHICVVGGDARQRHTNFHEFRNWCIK